MGILVNKTRRAIDVDGLLLVPGVPQEVGDVQSLISSFPRFAQLVEVGDIVIKEKPVKKQKQVEPQNTEQEEESFKRRSYKRKKE